MTQLTIDPYAPPEAVVEGRGSEADQEIWREGKFVVCARDAHLPDRCAVCNEPAQGYGFLKKMTWHSPWFFLLILANLLIYLIVALCVQKTAKIRIGLCPRHRARRERGLWVGFLGLAVSIVCLASPALVVYPDGGLARDVVPMVGLVGLVLCPILGVLMTQLVRPRRVDQDHAWLRVGKPFASSFPERD